MSPVPAWRAALLAALAFAAMLGWLAAITPAAGVV